MAILLVFIGAFMASCGAWVATTYGAGLSPDSVVYIEAARHLLAGEGFKAAMAYGIPMPLTLVPPGYPFLLAAVMKCFRWDAFTAVRGISVFLFGSLTALTGGWTYWRTKRLSATVAALLMTAGALDLMVIYSMAWSETPFLVLTCAGLWCLESTLDRPSRSRLLMAACFTAMAWLTRYAGIATFAAGLLVLIGFGGKTIRQRISDVVLFALVAGLPTGAWLLRNSLLTHHATSRQFAFHPLWGDLASAASRASSLWLFQLRSAGPVATFAALILLAGLGVLWKRYRSHYAHATYPTLWVFSACYILLVIGMLFFFEASLLSLVEWERILCPLHMAVIIMGLTALSDIRHPPAFRKLFSAAFVLAGLYFGYSGANSAEELSGDGMQYASRAWKSSPTLAALQKVPSSMQIYTNGDCPVYLYAQRYALEFPPKIFNSTLQPNPDYAKDMSRIQEEVAKKTAIVVYFNEEGRPDYPAEEDMERFFRTKKMEMEDGLIYGL